MSKPGFQNIIKSFCTIKEFSTNIDCPVCKQRKLRHITALLWGPYSGLFVCECGHKERTFSFLAQNLVTIEPLTDEE